MGGLCSLLASPLALAQTAEPSMKLRSSPRMQERITPDQAKDAPTFLQADRLTGQTDLQTELEGNAILRKPGTVIKADRLVYDQPSDKATATGNVRVNRNGNVYEGPLLEMQVDSFEGFFVQPNYQLLQNQAHGTAQRIDFLDETHAVAHTATYTTCRRSAVPGWAPSWVLRTSRLLIDNDEEIGSAQSAYIDFKGVPLPIPPISFSLSEKRKSGFLPFTLGVDDLNGLTYMQPYYWNIAPNRDATITPTYLEKRGVNVASEFRYLEPSYSGQARLSYMPNDKLRDQDRWALMGAHNGGISTPIGGVGIALNINRQSDDNYWRDFTTIATTTTTATTTATDTGLATALAAPRVLPSSLVASWARGSLSTSLTVMRWQTLQQPSPMAPPYDMLPQIAARYAKINDRGLDWSVDAALSQFSSEPRYTGQPNAQRAYVWGQASYPLQTAAAYLTPKVQWHGTSYQFDPITTGTFADQRSATSVVPTFSLDSGVVFEREAAIGKGAFIQTLEPRAFYVLTPYTNQSLLPNYDSGAQDFNFASIFSENAFVGHDKISDNNLLTVGATSRLIDPESGAQWARFGLAQRIRFEDQKVTINNGGVPALAGISDVLLGAGLNINNQWQTDSTVQYNVKTQQSTRAVVGARYSPTDYRVLNFAYRFQGVPSEQVETSWQWPIQGFWKTDASPKDAAAYTDEGRYYALGRLNYSVTDARMVQTLLGIEYDAGCWLARVVVDRTQTSLTTAVQRIMFEIEFVGFSRIGLSPGQTLRNSIPRYQELRGTTDSPSRFSNYD